MRKIIQIAVTEGYADEYSNAVSDGSFLALCEDGTVWSRASREDPRSPGSPYHWRQIPDIPQDDRIEKKFSTT